MSSPRLETIPALVERVFVGVAQRDELVVLLELGELEAGDPSDRLIALARATSSARRAAQLALRRHAIESADPHVDRMDLAPAEQGDDGVSDLLQLKPRFTASRIVVAMRIASGIAEEVGRMQHVDVQHVALDPLAAVEQAAQRAQRTVHA